MYIALTICECNYWFVSLDVKMAAYRNKNADKISKSVVNIVDITMTMFYVHVLKLCYHYCGCKILYCTVNICIGIGNISCEISISYHIVILLYQWITNFVPYYFHSVMNCSYFNTLYVLLCIEVHTMSN